MRVPTVEARRRPLGLRGWLIGAAVVIVVLLLSVRGLARFYTDYLWFDDVGFDQTWRSLWSAKVVPALIFGSVFFVIMLVNLIVADRVAPRYRGSGPEDEIIERYRGYVAPYAGRVRVLVSLFFAIVMGSGVAQQWEKWVLFRNASDFGVKDPEFHKDIGFYVFELPFIRYAIGWFFAALLVVLIVTAVWHYLNGGIRLQSPFQRVTPQVKAHLSVLLALMALTKAFGYYYARFALTSSRRGTVDGATYTDLHAQLPALNLLILISAAAAGLFIYNIWRKGWIFPIIAVGLWGFISILIGTIYPAVIQRFQVQPNELSREEPYIARNIDATRAAFKLATDCEPKPSCTPNIQQESFPYETALDSTATKDAQKTLDNVRLYDPIPAGDAFKLDQARSAAYEFLDVDVDRYEVGAEKAKPSLVSVRELNQQNLPDKSWTSQHLVYTHGYGAVVAAADEVGGDNNDQPSYVLQNIPPTGELADQLDEKFASVYFGEGLTGYSVVKTKVAEQNIQAADATVEAPKYESDAGVPMSSFLRKAALSLRFGDWNLFVSGQLTNESSALFIRDVRERAQNAAPFLKFDSDPYPVIVDGRIVWILDAYTTTSNYPYSQAINPEFPEGVKSGLDFDFNYVRNSVKATVDAYDGSIKFYVVDPTDPIIRTYRKAFPGLFSDEQPSEELRAHFRYPQDLFSTQTEHFALYHISDPTEYFNKQDIWDVTPTPGTTSTESNSVAAQQQGNNGGRNTTLPPSGSPALPLYLTLQLPGQEQPEFVLQRSFTPRTRSGILTSFIMARSDGDHYGELMLYNVSGAEAPSPFKAASAIDSDAFISQQLSLLDRAGSKVKPKGQEQLIPIGDAIMYVRPIWIEASEPPYPRFRFVAAVTGDRAVMGYDVDDVKTALLGPRGTQTRLQRDVNGGRSITDLANQPNNGTNNGNGSTTTTTTTPPNTTPGSTLPPGNQTAEQLLALAQREFDQAQAALEAGNLGEYQRHVAAAQAAVNSAAGKITASTTSP